MGRGWFIALKIFSDELNALKLTLLKQDYDESAFGSWLVRVAKAKSFVDFSWDGKEFYLGIQHGKLLPGGRVEWDETSYASEGIGGSTLTIEEIFAHMVSHLKSSF